ncbi:MAG: hypothetical protein M3N42_14115, partial [Cyanobacteriota bacterium]|nr:hypothetical protein [Cyanobacteriota bacterium]
SSDFRSLIFNQFKLISRFLLVSRSPLAFYPTSSFIDSDILRRAKMLCIVIFSSLGLFAVCGNLKLRLSR